MNELEMKQSAIEVVNQAHTFEVTTQQDYNNAAEICKDIKYRLNQIVDYWKPLKNNAYQAWKQICDKERELSEPFTKAESEIKNKMVAFQRAKMEEERLLREEQERWKKEETERLLKLAEQAESEGEQEHSDYLLEVAEETHNKVFEAPKQVKVPDTATKKVWKARVINEKLVPVEIMGTCIRPVDMSALDKLAKFSKGQTVVPGVEFYEDIQIAVRTR